MKTILVRRLRAAGVSAAGVIAVLMLRPCVPPAPAASPTLQRPVPRPAVPGWSGPAWPGRSGGEPQPPEAASLERWRERLEALLATGLPRQDAVERLAEEVDGQYHRWVSAEVENLARRPPSERYDRLAEIEQEVMDGAAAIFESLEVGGAPPAMVLADALEVIAAEVQYAEAAPSPAARLAVLRLDQERQARLERLVAAAGSPEAAEPGRQRELDAWYDAQMAGIVALASPAPASGGEGASLAVGGSQ